MKCIDGSVLTAQRVNEARNQIKFYREYVKQGNQFDTFYETHLSTLETGLKLLHKVAISEYYSKDKWLAERQAIYGRCNQTYREEVLQFIADFIYSTGASSQDVIRKQFHGGYCYYFAIMLQTAFKRGRICVAYPYGHIVWVDEDNVAYDIDGVTETEFTGLIDVSELGDGLDDFMHVPNKFGRNTPEEIEQLGECLVPGKVRLEDYSGYVQLTVDDEGCISKLITPTGNPIIFPKDIECYITDEVGPTFKLPMGVHKKDPAWANITHYDKLTHALYLDRSTDDITDYNGKILIYYKAPIRNGKYIAIKLNEEGRNAYLLVDKWAQGFVVRDVHINNIVGNDIFLCDYSRRSVNDAGTLTFHKNASPFHIKELVWLTYISKNHIYPLDDQANEIKRLQGLFGKNEFHEDLYNELL